MAQLPPRTGATQGFANGNGGFPLSQEDKERTQTFPSSQQSEAADQAPAQAKRREASQLKVDVLYSWPGGRSKTWQVYNQVGNAITSRKTSFAEFRISLKIAVSSRRRLHASGVCPLRRWHRGCVWLQQPSAEPGWPWQLSALLGKAPNSS